MFIAYVWRVEIITHTFNIPKDCDDITNLTLLALKQLTSPQWLSNCDLPFKTIEFKLKCLKSARSSRAHCPRPLIGLVIFKVKEQFYLKEFNENVYWKIVVIALSNRVVMALLAAGPYPVLPDKTFQRHGFPINPYTTDKYQNWWEHYQQR